MSVLAGARAPERFRVRIENPADAAEPLDLATVTSISLAVACPHDSRKTWAVTFIEQTSTRILVEHVFAATGADVEHAGRYTAIANMTVPDGLRRAGPFVLVVTSS